MLDDEKATTPESQTERSSASEDSRTAQQDDELVIDPTKKYLVNKRLGKVVTGSQLRDMLGEVELKRKVESENSKLKDELTRMRDELAQIRSQLDRYNIQQEVMSVLKGRRQQDNDFEYSFDLDEDSGNDIDPDKLVSRIDSVAEKLVEKKLGSKEVDVKSLIASELERIQEEQNQKESARQVFDTTQKETIRAFKAEMPDIPDDDIKEIAEKMAIVDLLKEESTLAFARGDREVGAEKWQDSVALQRDIYNRLAELREEQKQLEKRRRREQEVESITLGTRKMAEEEPVFSRTLNPAKAQENIEEIKRRAREIASQLQRLRQP